MNPCASTHPVLGQHYHCDHPDGAGHDGPHKWSHVAAWDDEPESDGPVLDEFELAELAAGELR